jgi:hypothetical protein
MNGSYVNEVYKGGVLLALGEKYRGYTILYSTDNLGMKLD